MTTISPLVVLDCDSTSIEQEVIELIAEHSGTAAEVAKITTAAMRGEIDFADSLKRRVATLKGVPVTVFRAVADRITFSPGFRELTERTAAAGGKVCVVSGGFTEVLDLILPGRGVSAWLANRLESVDGVLTGELRGQVVDAAAKKTALTGWAAEFQIPLSHTIAVGDGANDLEMLRTAAISVGFKPKPAVRAVADYSFDSSLAPVADLFSHLPQSR